MSAPLFIRTPYMLATRTTGTDGAPEFETVASHAETKTTTLLIETLRYWYTPPPLGGRGAGHVQLAVLKPDTTLVYLEQQEIAAADEGEYASPVVVQLDLLLPPGHALQLLSTPVIVQSSFTAACHVVVQGGELG